MFNVVCDGKVIGSAGTCPEACSLAKTASVVPGNVTRGGVQGRCVSVWSGPAGRVWPGVTKHAAYVCGRSW